MADWQISENMSINTEIKVVIGTSFIKKVPQPLKFIIFCNINKSAVVTLNSANWQWQNTVTPLFNNFSSYCSSFPVLILYNTAWLIYQKILVLLILKKTLFCVI